MPIITLRFKDKKILDFPLTVGQSCTIGRKKSNDIVIDNLAVSSTHARIESISSTFVLRDLESTNGTYVNKSKIVLHNLRHQDVITIGKHELVFDRSDLMKKTAKEADIYQDDKTRIIDTSEYRDVLHPREGAAPGKAQSASSPSSERQKKSFFSRLLEKLFG